LRRAVVAARTAGRVRCDIGADAVAVNLTVRATDAELTAVAAAARRAARIRVRRTMVVVVERVHALAVAQHLARGAVELAAAVDALVAGQADVAAVAAVVRVGEHVDARAATRHRAAGARRGAHAGVANLRGTARGATTAVIVIGLREDAVAVAVGLAGAAHGRALTATAERSRHVVAAVRCAATAVGVVGVEVDALIAAGRLAGAAADAIRATRARAADVTAGAAVVVVGERVRTVAAAVLF